MPIIKLSHGQADLEIDLCGAFLVSLKHNRKDILFPRAQLKNSAGEIKTRGGLHVCLPNFGPDDRFGLKQHGFGREMDWILVQQSDNKVMLELLGDSQPYEKLKSTLGIVLENNKLELELVLKNLGDTTLDVAPAFHPYFLTGADEKLIMVDGESLKLNELSGTIFRNNVKTAKINGGKFVFRQTGLSCFAIWTDLLGSYVCVEPSFAGNAFVDGRPDTLAPSEAKFYSFSLAW